MSAATGKKPEKRSRMERWTRFIGALSRLIWVVAVVVILALVGRWLFFRGSSGSNRPRVVTKPVVQQVDWKQVDADVARVLRKGREVAQASAAKRLDAWIEKNMERVDADFLPWYFSYWTQQELGLKSLLYQVVHWVDSGTPTGAERITQRVQEEFAARVLRPQVAQMEVERLVKDTVALYAESVRKGLAPIPGRYDIHPAQWDRYTGDVAVMVGTVDSGRSVSLSLKALTGVTAGGAVVLFRMLRPALSRITARVSARMAGRAATKMASKTGAKAAARAGGRFAGTIIAVGIIIWDVWDHYQTRKKALPVLRRNIMDYFAEMKQALLLDPEFGVMTVIAGLEQKLAERKEKSIQ